MAKIRKGTYRYNDALMMPSDIFGVAYMRIAQDMVFKVSTNIEGTNYEIVGNGMRVGSDMPALVYDVESVTPSGGSINVGSSPTIWWEDVWDLSRYGTGVQTITIPTDQEVSAEFATWFDANTKTLATISYQDITIPVDVGQTVQLHLSEKKLEDDLFVRFPSGYIKPAGTKEILENGTHDVTEVASIVVNVPPSVLTYYDGSVTIFGGVELISFTVAGTSYQAIEGMTWAEWCDSSYNTGGFENSGTLINYYGDGYPKYIKGINVNNAIQADGVYELKAGGGADD